MLTAMIGLSGCATQPYTYDKNAYASNIGGGYNPCANLPAQVVTDTLVGATIGALFGSHDRGRGAGYGAGAGLAGSYVLRQRECQRWRQQESIHQQMNAWESERNAPRTDCRATKEVDADGHVTMTEHCTAQATRGGYRNW
ncbi:MAG: hypothetical protein ACSLEX_00130 [Minisyncoccota bacterium]